ncbi:MAG: response regulator transcription factor [Candidatus Binatia bacterium]
MKHMNITTDKSALATGLALEATSSVFLVDDDASVRRALARLIKCAGHNVQTFASAREFLGTETGSQDAGCLVLDVRMPGFTGIELQRELQTMNRNLPIVFITGHGDIPMSVNAMKAGAVDFLQKPVKDKDLLTAIEQSLARAAREQSEREEIAQIRRRVENLTPRELEVMALVVTGMLNKQIAFKLGTVEKTIKVHRARVMDKMGVASIAELVRIAEKINIPPEKKP